MDSSDLKKRHRKIQFELDTAQADLAGCGVNHILHLILSIITAGFWLLVWVFVAASNGSKASKLKKNVVRLQNSLIDAEYQLDSSQAS